MIEKTEWEIIDDASTTARSSRRAPRMTPESVLGSWWKVKLAGIAAVTIVAFAFFAAVISIAAVSLAALALAATVLRKFVMWLRGVERGTSVSKL